MGKFVVVGEDVDILNFDGKNDVFWGDGIIVWWRFFWFEDEEGSIFL